MTARRRTPRKSPVTDIRTSMAGVLCQDGSTPGNTLPGEGPYRRLGLIGAYHSEWQGNMHLIKNVRLLQGS